MNADGTEALIWALIASAHAEATAFEFKKAEIIYRAEPSERRLGLWMMARAASGFATNAAQQAEHSLTIADYSMVIELAHRTYLYMTHARNAASQLKFVPHHCHSGNLGVRLGTKPHVVVSQDNWQLTRLVGAVKRRQV